MIPAWFYLQVMKRSFRTPYYRIFVVSIFASTIFVATLFAMSSSDAQDAPSPDLPFNREIINRYSLDHLPRSLSIRQAADVWLGYDLERAKLYKLWRAPANGSGLEKKDFTVRSVGTTLYQDQSEASWQLQRKNKLTPVRIRYQGCSHQAETIELKWELKCEQGTKFLFERIPVAGELLGETCMRDLRVEGMEADESLLPPTPTQNAWKITKLDGTATGSFQDSHWHRLTLR